MDIPRLKIEQQPSKIGLATIKHRFELEKKKPQLEIEQGKGKLNIKQDNVQIQIDGYPHNYDLGYKNIHDRGQEIADRGYQISLLAVKTYTREGNRLADITSATNEIATQAKEKVEEEEKELGLRWKRGPKINVESPELNINYKISPLSFRVKRGTIEGTFNWGQVEVKIKQLYRTEITVIGGKFNKLS